MKINSGNKRVVVKNYDVLSVNGMSVSAYSITEYTVSMGGIATAADVITIQPHEYYTKCIDKIRRYMKRGASLKAAYAAASVDINSSTFLIEKSTRRDRIKSWQKRRNLVDSPKGVGRYISFRLEKPTGEKSIFQVDLRGDPLIPSSHPYWKAVDDAGMLCHLTAVNRYGLKFVYCPNGVNPGKWVCDHGNDITQTVYGFDWHALAKIAVAIPLDVNRY